MYPADQITEERPEDTIAELVRGAFLEELDDELPHSLAVVVDSIEYPEDNETGEAYDGKVEVIVSIYVERDSQKPIIIGKGAEHLVRVKKKLRTPVNRIVGRKAKLDLHVKVAKGWQSDPKQLERLGLSTWCASRRSCARRSTASSGARPSWTCMSRWPRAGSPTPSSSNASDSESRCVRRSPLRRRRCKRRKDQRVMRIWHMTVGCRRRTPDGTPQSYASG